MQSQNDERRNKKRSSCAPSGRWASSRWQRSDSTLESREELEAETFFKYRNQQDIVVNQVAAFYCRRERKGLTSVRDLDMNEFTFCNGQIENLQETEDRHNPSLSIECTYEDEILHDIVDRCGEREGVIPPKIQAGAEKIDGFVSKMKQSLCECHLWCAAENRKR